MWPIVEELCYLATLLGVRPEALRHTIVGAKFPDPLVLTPKTLLTYSVPPNFTWVVTYIKLRSFPLQTDIPLADGDFRSDDYDLDGSTKIYFTQNGSPVTPQNAVHTVWINRPVFFAFQGGLDIALIAQRVAGSTPANPGINVSINGYLTDAQGLEKLNPFLTNIYATYAP